MSIVRKTTHIRAALALAALASLAACSGGGAPTEVNPVTTPPPVADYTGPAPANADVQAFRINLWENVKASNRCGGCHNAGGQTPNFARNDDVNLAYQAAIALVDLTQPDQSRLVTKVAGGHNCWLASASACGDTMTVWIRNWAGSVAGGGKTIQLVEPPVKEVGASKTFPDSSSLYGTTIWPLVRGQGNCLRCHTPASATAQSPFFASADLDAAYAAARPKINLDAPELSRLVVRLREESHNCWTSSCANDASTMEAAVRAFANGVPVTPVDPTLQLSKAITLYDGTVAAGGNRYETAQVALYEFKTGMGTTVYDTSGVEPAANLTMSGSIEWVGGWGLNVKPGGKAQGTTSGSRKLADMIKASGEYSIEAWVAPGNVVQEDAYIVSYSGGTMANNATLSQMAYRYQAMTRSSDTDANGAPALLTRAEDEDAQASLQHVVLTYDPVNGQRIYVNGQYTGDTDGQGGSLSDWDDSFALVLGNDPSGQRQWTGTIRLVAVHNRALSLTQIQQNFAAGVGERYFMLFNVSELLNLPKSYVMFEASQYDSYSYLFTKPTFISLDSGVAPSGIPLKGMRIGLNGQEARVGQAYVPLDLTVGGANYVAGTGQLLSDTGTVIGLEKGPDSDLFFLTFEQLGTQTRVYPEPPMPVPQVPADSSNPEIGLRTFDEINRTMSNITGVPVTTASVAGTYDLVRQALPSVESIDTFGSSQQMGIAQLAISYCDAMVEDTTLRNAFFGGAVDVNTQAGRDAMITSLVGKAVGTNLVTQPTDAEVRPELNGLVTRLAASCGGSCDATRSATIAKASCAAAIGSAAMLLQ
ncbi:MAG: LamG domain-containing protein [Steroidobacteraceae bacterium]